MYFYCTTGGLSCHGLLQILLYFYFIDEAQTRRSPRSARMTNAPPQMTFRGTEAKITYRRFLDNLNFAAQRRHPAVTPTQRFAAGSESRQNQHTVGPLKKLVASDITPATSCVAIDIADLAFILVPILLYVPVPTE